MIVNGQHLLAAMPIKGMVAEKRRLHRFTLASAIEEFQMPADLVGVVHDKSTWARQTCQLQRGSTND